MKDRTKPRVLFRTDGNDKIGMGHIYRTIGLAQFFKKSGFEICFLTSKNKLLTTKIKLNGKHITTNQKIK